MKKGSLLILNFCLFVCLPFPAWARTGLRAVQDTIPTPTAVSHKDKGLSGKYIDIDTAISVSLFDLKAMSASLSPQQKKEWVENAVRQAMGDDSYIFFETSCLSFDETRGEIKRETTEGLDCKLRDFHLIDLDLDGDLDMVYSSLIDQYLNWDNNQLMLFQNNNGKFSFFKVDGYLYAANFELQNKGQIIFKNITRPCCDNSSFNFYETEFDCKQWTFKTHHVLEIHKSKVQEQL